MDYRRRTPRGRESGGRPRTRHRTRTRRRTGRPLFFSSRRRHTRYWRDWSSDVCSSDLEALAIALRTAGPAIAASGCTVIAALLCLTIAEVEGTAGLGPIGALGIAVAMVAMLTLLPALLVITGRRMFWRPPVFGWGNGIPHFGDEGADETHGAWRKVGDRVAKAPRRVWLGALAVLLVMC